MRAPLAASGAPQVPPKPPRCTRCSSRPTGRTCASRQLERTFWCCTRSSSRASDGAVSRAMSSGGAVFAAGLAPIEAILRAGLLTPTRSWRAGLCCGTPRDHVRRPQQRPRQTRRSDTKQHIYRTATKTTTLHDVSGPCRGSNRAWRGVSGDDDGDHQLGIRHAPCASDTDADTASRCHPSSIRGFAATAAENTSPDRKDSALRIAHGSIRNHRHSELK